MVEENGTVAEARYRIVFIPDPDYAVMLEAISAKKKKRYEYLTDKGIENFMLEDGTVVYVPDAHKKFMQVKARTGAAL